MKSKMLVLILFLLSPALATADGVQRLYILNSSSDDVTVVDVATNQVIDSIRVGPKPHGLASPASQDILYVATEGDNSLAVVDLINNKRIAHYPVLGERPHEIEVTADGRYVYIPANRDGVYEVFDTEKGTIITRIPVDGGPHNVVVSPDDRYMYLSPLNRPKNPDPEKEKMLGALESRNIYIVDTASHTIVDKIPLENAPRPTAISPDGKRLYANTDALLGFVVIDIDSRRVISQAEYELTTEERAAPSRSHGIGVTPNGTEVWSTDINHGLVHVFDVTGDQPRQIARIETGNQPLWLTITPDGKTVYVSNRADNTVSVFDVAAKQEIKRIQLEKGKNPQRIQVVTVPLPETPIPH